MKSNNLFLLHHAPSSHHHATARRIDRRGDHCRSTVKPGEKVAADQKIIEVETNKAVMGVTTPCAGEIAKIDAQLKETYPIGAVLGYIEASEKDAARFAKQAPPPEVQREMTEEIPGRNEETARGEKTTKVTAPEQKFR